VRAAIKKELARRAAYFEELVIAVKKGIRSFSRLWSEKERRCRTHQITMEVVECL
jgi:hypothetical protein